MVNYSLNTWDGAWVSDPYIGLNSTLEYAEIMYELGCVNKSLTKEDLFDFSFYEKMTRERGVGKGVNRLFESFQRFCKEG